MQVCVNKVHSSILHPSLLMKSTFGLYSSCGNSRVEDLTEFVRVIYPTFERITTNFMKEFHKKVVCDDLETNQKMTRRTSEDVFSHMCNVAASTEAGEK